ncbi:MAG: trypsin-like peptidase domain-containing protein [Proteobacteria bacterium]|nr:trypsin-like peptidase domain-containing protein [Pseudomonadota bacterium]
MSAAPSLFWRVLPWVLTASVLAFVAGRSTVPKTTAPAAFASYAEVYDRVAPVVVNVSLSEPDTRVGSGFAVARDQVVTARHLVVGARDVVVQGADGKAVWMRVVGTDARTDLALLRAESPVFEPAVLGSSDALVAGDTLLAIGNPYGLGHSLAVGVLGSRERRLVVREGGPSVDFLQLTIPLNPGNSGGPIFDGGGRIVGILAGTHSEGQAIAFAVPVEVLKDVLPALGKGARMTRAYLGARAVETDGGLMVSDVVPSGPADRAGVRVGDLLKSLDGQPLDTPETLRALLDGLPAGQRATLTFRRDGEDQAVDVGLTDWAERAVAVAGMTLRPNPGTGGRVVAVRPRSRAEKAGVRVGDIVRTVDGIPVRAPADVQDMLDPGEPAQIEAVRNGVPVVVQL